MQKNDIGVIISVDEEDDRFKNNNKRNNEIKYKRN